MKILITTLFLESGTGTETFVYTISKYLQSKGHSVTVYSHFVGEYKNNFLSIGIPVIENKRFRGLKISYSDVFFVKLCKIIKIKIYASVIFNYFFPIKDNFDDFDIVHFQHKSTVYTVYPKVKNIAKTFISHGKLSSEEQVARYSLFPMDRYLAVSEEVKDNISRRLPKTFADILIIRNVIDTEKFKTHTIINQSIKNILVISKEILIHKNYIDLLKKVSATIGAEIEFIGFPNKHVKDTKKYIEKADLVVGIGRCAYEAMSMGRNVLVLDYLGLDGLIDSEEIFQKMRYYNLSGRYKNNTEFTYRELVEETNKYKQNLGVTNRNLIKKYNDISKIGYQLESIYISAIKNNNAKNLSNYNVI